MPIFQRDDDLYFLHLLKTTDLYENFIQLMRIAPRQLVLNLKNCIIHHKQIEILQKLNWLNLQELIIHDAQYDYYHLKGLLIAMPNLHRLKLVNNSLHPDGLFLILLMKNWDVEWLEMSGNMIGDKGIRSMTIAVWPKLQILKLANNGLTSRCLPFLVDADIIAIRKIDLSFNRLTDSAAKVLKKGKWRKLLALVLIENLLGEDFMRGMTLSQWPQFQQFQIFNQHHQLSNLKGGLPLTLSSLKYLAKGSITKFLIVARIQVDPIKSMPIYHNLVVSRRIYRQNCRIF